MRASPGISIPGECGDTCTVGTRPVRDYKTIHILWRLLPFSLTDADGHIVDDNSGAVHGQLPPVAGVSFLCRPPRREKFASP